VVYRASAALPLLVLGAAVWVSPAGACSGAALESLDDLVAQIARTPSTSAPEAIEPLAALAAEHLVRDGPLSGEAAAERLASAGGAAGAVLRRCLSGGRVLRLRAAYGLYLADGADAELISALGDALTRTDPRLRHVALHVALIVTIRLGGPASGTKPGASPDWQQRWRAALEAGLGSAAVRGSAGDRMWAAYALASLGETDVAVSMARLLLHDSSHGLRTGAATLLRQMGRASLPALDDLLATLGDGRDAGAAASLALVGLGEVAICGLCERAETGATEARCCALFTLSAMELGAAGPAVAERVLTLLSDSDSRVRASAARVLGSVRGADVMWPRVREALLALAGDSSSEVRASVALALGRLSHRDEVVTDALAGALRDPDARVQLQAAISLARLGSDAGSPVLEALKNSPDATMRGQAIDALRRWPTS